MQDVGSLVGLARRFCTDEKAGVRKAGVQLLEALLLLRASGRGGAEAVLPSPVDVGAIQHAAADPMVGPCGGRLKFVNLVPSTKLDRTNCPSTTLRGACLQNGARAVYDIGCQGRAPFVFYKGQCTGRP